VRFVHRPDFLGIYAVRHSRDAHWTLAPSRHRIARFRVGKVRNYAMSRAYLCVSIAATGDRDGRGGRRDPASFQGIAEGIARRIQPFFERFGARPTYLLSREVLEDPGSLETVRRLVPFSELGTHLDAASSTEREALTDLTDLFIRAFGHQPLSFRAGPKALGAASIGILESLGYAVDGSVTPYLGRTPWAPTQPYRPDPGEPGQAGDSAMLEVPITIRRRLLGGVPGIGRRMSPRGLLLGSASATRLVRVAEDELAAARRDDPSQPVVLHAVLDCVDVVPGASAHSANEEEARSVLDGLRALLDFARRTGMPVVGLADVPELLSERRRSGSRT
jgi:hypothetical protein